MKLGIFYAKAHVRSRRPNPAVMDVEIAGAGGAPARFTATADHPWLVVRGEGRVEWVQTIDLKPGDQLVTEDADRLTFKSATLRNGPASASAHVAVSCGQNQLPWSRNEQWS